MLECFAPERMVAGVTELSGTLGLGRSTTHRYATTLHALGYLEQDEHRKYRLARRALEPGLAAVGAVRAAVPAAAALAELRASSGHTVGMGVLDGTRAIYVDRLHAHGPGQHQADGERRAGSALPLHCSALGKALLAALPGEELRALIRGLSLDRRGPNSIAGKRRLSAELRRVRESGLALGDEELAAGVRSAAVSLPLACDGRPLAIDVAVPASAFTVERLAAELGPLLSQAAQRIAAATPPAPEPRSTASSRRHSRSRSCRRA